MRDFTKSNKFKFGTFAKGGGGSTTSNTTVQLSEGQKELDRIAAENARAIQPLYGEVIAGASNPANNPIYYPGSTVAGFNPVQMAGMGEGINNAAFGSNVVNPLINSSLAFGMGIGPNSALAPNPYLMDFMRVQEDPMVSRFQSEVLPEIGSEAVKQGAFGGVRHGLAEANAAGALAKQVGDMRTSLAFEGYNRGLDTFDRTLAGLPQTLEATDRPANLLMEVGDTIQAQQQAEIDAAIDRFNFIQNPDLQRYKQYAELIGMTQGGAQPAGTLGTTTTGTTASGGK